MTYDETNRPVRVSRLAASAVARGDNQKRLLKDIQIHEAQRYIGKLCAPSDLNPVRLAQGGKTQVLALLRQAVHGGSIPELTTADEETIEQLYSFTVGLGVLDRFLADGRIEQINIHGPKTILLQVNGLWQPVTDETLLFEDVAEVRRAAESLARRVDKDLARHNMPILDIRFDNPVLRIHINQTRRDYELGVYIRRGRPASFETTFLLRKKMFDTAVWEILREAAQRLISTVFLGPVGSGKTVLLEKYIDCLPNVPIVIVDDAGDCQPTHPMCAIYDLPPASYFDNDTSKQLSLGGMTRAALREGDVLVVAETRGGAEAGTLISEALSMRAVVTTAHGESPQSGLTRLATIAQRPPSVYAGMNDDMGVRRDLTTAFPLIVQVDRKGEQRYVSGVYHNLGWNRGDWHLAPIVTTRITDHAEIVWDVVGSLDGVKATSVFDKMQQGEVATYEASSTKRHLHRGLLALDERGWDTAVSELSQAWKFNFGHASIITGLQKALPHAEVYPQIITKEVEAREQIEALRKACKWLTLSEAMERYEEDALVYSLLLLSYKNWKVLRSEVERNGRIEARAKALIHEVKGLPKTTPWRGYLPVLERLESLQMNGLSLRARQVVKEHHIVVLQAIVAAAPLASQVVYRNKLGLLVGERTAEALLTNNQDEVQECH